MKIPLQFHHRSLITLASRTVRTARRNGLPRSDVVSASIRPVATLSLNRGATSSRSGHSYPENRHGYGRGGYQYIFLQVRHQSSSGKGSGSELPTLKQWKFEDITSSLPSTSPTSPSHKPQIQTPILIDVREPAELSSTGIIPGAISVPLGSQPDALFLSPEEFETRFGFPKPGVEPVLGADKAQAQPIVFYCKAGVRAKTAAQLATQAGYDPARLGVYEGSWLDWASKGGPVEKWEGEH